MISLGHHSGIPGQNPDSEWRGQEEAGRTQHTSELFTRTTTLKFVNTKNIKTDFTSILNVPIQNQTTFIRQTGL